MHTFIHTRHKHTHISYTHAHLTVDTGGRPSGLQVPLGLDGQTSEGIRFPLWGGCVSQVEHRGTRESWQCLAFSQTDRSVELEQHERAPCAPQARKDASVWLFSAAEVHSGALSSGPVYPHSLQLCVCLSTPPRGTLVNGTSHPFISTLMRFFLLLQQYQGTYFVFYVSCVCFFYLLRAILEEQTSICTYVIHFVN